MDYNKFNTRFGFPLWVFEYEWKDIESGKDILRCQVYTDEDLKYEIDKFVVHPDLFVNENNKNYDNIGDVPYLEIRKFIREYVWNIDEKIILNSGLIK